MTLPDAETIFLALADVAPGDREEFLQGRCGNDIALRREVDALFAALEVPDEFLDPERRQFIVTRTGKPALRVIYDGYDKALAVYGYDRDPNFREPVLRALARAILNMLRKK